MVHFTMMAAGRAPWLQSLQLREQMQQGVRLFINLLGKMNLLGKISSSMIATIFLRARALCLSHGGIVAVTIGCVLQFFLLDFQP
jgi:hypothetical protein